MKSDEIDVVRPIFQLTTADIPTFNGMTQTKYGEKPLSIDEIIEGIFTELYEFRWDSDDGEYAYIDVWVAESKNMAFDLLEEMQKTWTIPKDILEERKDKPAAVGDISYSKGSCFIRDNFIIILHVKEKFTNHVNEIAKHVDAKILSTKPLTN